MELAMTGDGTEEQEHYETSYDLEVWKWFRAPDGNMAAMHFGLWQWGCFKMGEDNRWRWVPVPDLAEVYGTLSDADRRAIEAAKPTGGPVVRLDVKP
jgi:hypothetical protein